jgi:hypothetical protein
VENEMTTLNFPMKTSVLYPLESVNILPYMRQDFAGVMKLAQPQYPGGSNVITKGRLKSEAEEEAITQ